MFNVSALDWDEELISLFGIKKEMLAEICDSNALYGYTDFDGYLEEAIPIHGVMGDSHGALYGQGCVNPGMIKATYGTGSSIMMNVGEKPIFSDKGVVTSLAWSLSGKVNYVLEGNINYTGAVITWLQKDLGLIASAKETEELAKSANPGDTTYLVPAFTGLGAPYWDSKAKAVVSGITRTTGKAELVRAALDCMLWARHMPLESLWEFTNRLHYLKVLTAPDLPLRWMRRQDAQNIQAGKRVLDSY